MGLLRTGSEKLIFSLILATPTSFHPAILHLDPHKISQEHRSTLDKEASTKISTVSENIEINV